MKRIFLLLIFFLFAFSCKKEISKSDSGNITISERVNYSDESKKLVINSGKFKNVIPKEKLPFRKAMLLNSSLIGYFSELNLENKIIGVSSPEYIFSEKIHQLINQNQILNIGNEQKYDIEKILSNKPDVIFTNYVPNFANTYDILKKNGIELIFLDEFLEQNPLEKSKYLLLFGKLFGAEEQAEKVFKNIEDNYKKIQTLASKTVNKPNILCNEMYGSQWFLPGGNSFVARLIYDAGGNYILKDNKESSSVPLSFEEVFVKSESVNYWINISPHQNRKELLTLNPNYSKMKVFNSGNLYMINNREKDGSNDYFESGVVRCDLVLRDYFKIFHPEDVTFKSEPLVYMKELK
ncbi:ABC transporter substrate-binding protein [Epilithonimonas zeae]|uniref:ABC transporter substrate-binding protein n=1 Tax=Epilithonimonas zeae TaxID=1416779 RepID=UPI00200F932F|nr:ABC transporter substrate-binding protein [Epilithonimonas zeae]UQB69779.1 ABC transporter substrate-binding protein [Epilithonimonas zeae]